MTKKKEKTFIHQPPQYKMASHSQTQTQTLVQVLQTQTQRQTAKWLADNCGLQELRRT